MYGKEERWIQVLLSDLASFESKDSNFKGEEKEPIQV